MALTNGTTRERTEIVSWQPRDVVFPPENKRSLGVTCAPPNQEMWTYRIFCGFFFSYSLFFFIFQKNKTKRLEEEEEEEVVGKEKTRKKKKKKKKGGWKKKRGGGGE